MDQHREGSPPADSDCLDGPLNALGNAFTILYGATRNRNGPDVGSLELLRREPFEEFAGCLLGIAELDDIF
jgi:hypothetical protein